MKTITAMDGFSFKKEPLEDSYEVGDDIGSGHFAVVRRAVHKKSGEAFAAKFIRKRRGGGRKGAKPEDIQREVTILRQLDHENVIRLYDVYETGIEVILILELVTGGELFDYISEKDHLGEEEASAFIAQILRGLKHLHDHNIAHLDLKPENIMLRNRNTQSIKLIDFGLAQRIHGKEDIRALMGTAEFVAPEVVSYETLSLATDMWSVGVITYILLSGASPFLGDNQQETYHNITAISYQFDEEYFANTSELAKDFITRLFIKIPKKRSTVEDCLNHPWIRPKEPLELIKRQSAVINIDNFKAFMARKRWKQSMRVVSLCNRLSKSILLRKSTETMGSRNTLDEEKRKHLTPVAEPSAPLDSFSEKTEGKPDTPGMSVPQPPACGAGTAQVSSEDSSEARKSGRVETSPVAGNGLEEDRATTVGGGRNTRESGDGGRGVVTDVQVDVSSCADNRESVPAVSSATDQSSSSDAHISSTTVRNVSEVLPQSENCFEDSLNAAKDQAENTSPSDLSTPVSAAGVSEPRSVDATNGVVMRKSKNVSSGHQAISSNSNGISVAKQSPACQSKLFPNDPHALLGKDRTVQVSHSAFVSQSYRILPCNQVVLGDSDDDIPEDREVLDGDSDDVFLAVQDNSSKSNRVSLHFECHSGGSLSVKKGKSAPGVPTQDPTVCNGPAS